MKIRVGFVSNSSSSSFLIVGIAGNDSRLAKLAVADGWEEGFGGYNEGKSLVFLGGEYDDPDGLYQPCYVGVEAEQSLKNGTTVLELKKEFISKAQALGINFRENEVDLYYGEVSSE